MPTRFGLNKKRLISVAQILLSLTLLFWLVRRVGLQDIVDTMSEINWYWYGLAFLLFQLNIIIRSTRWFVILRSLNDQARLGTLVYLYYIGFFANNFIPSGFGGDVVKVVSLRQRYGRGTEALSSVMMDRVTGLVGSSLVALAALIWNIVSRTATLELPSLLWGVVVLISIGVPTLFFLARWADPISFVNHLIPRVTTLPYYNKVENLVNTIHRYPMRSLATSLLITLPFTLTLILIQMSIGRAFGVDLPFTVFALLVPLMAIINLLPISFNGIGVRESLYTFLFVPLGVPPATAFSMSFAFLLLRLSAGLLGGLAYALRNVLGMVRPAQAENT